MRFKSFLQGFRILATLLLYTKAATLSPSPREARLRREGDSKLTVSVPQLGQLFRKLTIELNRASNPHRKRPTLSPLSSLTSFTAGRLELERYCR